MRLSAVEGVCPVSRARADSHTTVLWREPVGAFVLMVGKDLMLVVGAPESVVV